MIEIIVGFFAVLVVVCLVVAVVTGGWRVPPAGGLAVLLVCLLAVSAVADPAPPCTGSLALWTATETASGGNQSLVIGSRAEGGCAVGGLFRAWGRLDAYGLPGRTVSLADPSTFENVAAVEGWIGASRHVSGPLSFAVFGGLQRSLEGGQLGIGGAAQSFCAGPRLDYGGGLAIGGICSRYSPAQTLKNGMRVDGPALVGTVVLPVKKGVRFAANGSYLLNTHDYVFVAGPTVGVGF